MSQPIEQVFSSVESFIPGVTMVACVYLPSIEVYQAAQWYMQVFGMTCSPNTPLQPDMGHVILRAANSPTTLFLIACQPGWTLPQRKDSETWWNFCFAVDDIEATRQHLLAHSVRMESETIWDREGCGQNLRCFDLDGNKIEINQPPSSNERLG